MFKWYRLSLWISTTKWHYNRGKCVLPHNSHILYRTFKNLMSTRSLDCVESCDKGHAHSCKFAKCHKPTFSNSSQAISLICMKLRTQHLWTLLTKSFFFFFFLQVYFKQYSSYQITTSCTFRSNQEVLHISILVPQNDIKLSLLLPHEPLRLGANFWLITTRWHALNWSILYRHISRSD